MITAVDSNVLFDVFTGDDRHGPASKDALSRCLIEGRVVVGDVVWAEVSGAFGDDAEAARNLDRIGVRFEPMTVGGACLAGRAWRSYRRAGGPRTRLIADFLIGGHATATADRLLSRDRGFYRRYFTDLEVIDPTPSPEA